MTVLNPNRIVVPVSFCSEGARAIRAALSMTGGDPAPILVVHVLPHPERMSYNEIDEASRIENATKALRTWLADNDLPEPGRLDVRVGDPGSVIADYSDDMDAELIVIPPRRQRGLLTIGSVSRRVVRRARQPVLVLR